MESKERGRHGTPDTAQSWNWGDKREREYQHWAGVHQSKRTRTPVRQTSGRRETSSDMAFGGGPRRRFINPDYRGSCLNVEVPISKVKGKRNTPPLYRGGDHPQFVPRCASEVRRRKDSREEKGRKGKGRKGKVGAPSMERCGKKGRLRLHMEK